MNKDEKSSLLDPNHSHFILVDNAQYLFRGEIKFRAELEAKLAKTKKSPIIILAIGGGLGTLETILESLKKNTPCVVLEV